jgi:hypothetical protein
MNHKIRIIKRGDRKEPEFDRLEKPSRHTTRDITSTIKLWVIEFKENRRSDEQNARNTNKLIITTASQT